MPSLPSVLTSGDVALKHSLLLALTLACVQSSIIPPPPIEYSSLKRLAYGPLYNLYTPRSFKTTIVFKSYLHHVPGFVDELAKHANCTSCVHSLETPTISAASLRAFFLFITLVFLLMLVWMEDSYLLIYNNLSLQAKIPSMLNLRTSVINNKLWLFGEI